MAINLNKGDNTPNEAVNSNETVNETVENQNAGTSMAEDLGISPERNIFLIDIIKDTIQKMDDEGKEIDRATTVKACAQTLPTDMTMKEILYVGYIIQVKAEQYIKYRLVKKLQDALDGPNGVAEALKELFG